MSKIQYIDPEKKIKQSYINFKPISINRYDLSLSEEKNNYSKKELLDIYQDMFYIREFEQLIYNVRIYQEYKGTSYEYTGQGHLYTGQEAQAVGQAYVLDKDDFIFGTHRSHGEIIAKSLSAIRKLSDVELLRIMEHTNEGEILKAIENAPHSNIESLAKDFLFYGLLCELFARKNGFAAGLGGSMHAFCLPFGAYPNNAIVGASAPIATGAALYKKIQKHPGVCVVNIGDGSLGCGPVWESMNFAAMDQFTKLWEEPYNGCLPILFNFINNSYAMGGQTSGETMAYDILARVGAGISPSQMHAERINGLNPLSVIEATRRKKKLLINNKGPALLDVITYRYGGHSTSDPGPYRTEEEVKAWRKYDSIVNFGEQLIAEKIATREDLNCLHEEVENRLFDCFEKAIDYEISPRIDLRLDPKIIESYMFSNERIERMDDATCEMLQQKEDNSRIKLIAKKSRYAFQKGKEISKNKQVTIRDALFEAILDKFYIDPTLITYGEDLREWGGAFAVYNGLTEAVPQHRLFNSPISESAIIGSAVGYAMSGGRAIVELMYCDFMGRAGDELFNQLAKWQAMSAGILKMPVVVRISVGYKAGAQHSQDWSAIPSHIPGLKVVFPVTPYDAKGMMNAALMGTDPVIFFESQRLYDKGEYYKNEGIPLDYYEVPIGEPDIKRVGKDVTIVTIGAVLYEAELAADILARKHEVYAEIIDLRSLVPINYEPIIESVKKTGRLLVVGDACERGSFMNTVAQNITEIAFDYLDGPPVVIGSRNWITPFYELGEDYFPQSQWIVDVLHQKILPLDNYNNLLDFSDEEKIRRHQKGV